MYIVEYNFLYFQDYSQYYNTTVYTDNVHLLIKCIDFVAKTR